MPEPSEHKPMFSTKIRQGIIPSYQRIDVRERGCGLAGTLDVTASNADSLAAWIEAYPSLTEAAKVEVPKG